MIAHHAPDPDAIPISSDGARAYDAEAMRLGGAAPRPTRTLAYGPDRGQRLDIYAPPGARGLPILLFFHGGAWVSGHLGWLRFMAEPVREAGFILVAGTYRLAPRLRWPAQEEDVRAALAYVHANAHALGGDPGRIVIGGHSAGGHLASLVAVKAGHAPLAAAHPVACSFDLRYGDVPLESDQGRTYRYLFARRDQDADASPVAFVTARAPPFHIAWGERDLDRVAHSSRRMVDALGQAGVPVTHEVLAQANHFDAHLALADPDHPWYRRLRAAVTAPAETVAA